MRLATALVLFSLSTQAPGADSTTHTQAENATPDSEEIRAPRSRAALNLGLYSAEYSASYNGFPITTVRTLSRRDGQLVLSTEASNFLGSIREQETVATEEDGLTPHQYTYRRSIMGKKRTEVTEFTPGDATVTNTYKGETVTLPDSADLFGPLSYQLAMQLDLMAGAREVTYPVVTRGRIKDYTYKVIREEQLDTPLGTVDTLVLERQRDDDERETYLWLAPRFQYLPVKLRQLEDGENYEMLIQSYTSTDS